MIPKKITMKSCVGKRAIADRDLSNGVGTIEAGTRVSIVNSGPKDLDVRSKACPHCGVRLRVTQVSRDALTLLEEGPEERAE